MKRFVAFVILFFLLLLSFKKTCVEINAIEPIIFTSESKPIEIKKEVVQKIVTNTAPQVYPSQIPVTRQWVWYGGDGARNLKEHIILTHKISPDKLVNFRTEKDLVILHSYLHNGGKIE